jgi:hypothetical protein
MKKSKTLFFLSVISALFVLSAFVGKSTLAAMVQCEYIPRDSSGNILYFEGSDVEHRPWSKEMEEAECLEKCDSESITSLIGECRSWGGPFQDPDDCDVSHTSCGVVDTPTLTNYCKFTPKRPDGSIIEESRIKPFEIYTTSKSACQRLCDSKKEKCMAACDISGSSAPALAVKQALCCDRNKTTCEGGAASAAPTPHTFESVPPSLEIPLPTLPSLSEFADLTLQGEAPNRYLLIPWIGQYIAAIYKYAIGIVGVLAGIMIVVGGLLWLTAGGSAGRVSTAKSFIESSLVGLVIALTSYLLLYVINPNLVEFESLRVRYIERVEFVQNELLTTTVDTAGGETRWQGTCSESYPDCPITLNEPCVAGSGVGLNNPRAKEFLEKIKEILGGETAREKVLKIADAATKCGVVLGCCGKTVEQINEVAGISGKGPEREGIGSNNPLCAINCNSPGKTCRDLAESSECGKVPPSRPEKRQEVFELNRERNPGYPDEWLNLLEPGDAFDMYVANSAVGGQHAVIFVGWEEGREKAKVVEGASGKLVKYGSWCIKSTCPNPTPITHIYNAGE